MNKKNIKLLMELIFIFILPLLFICFTSEIQIERNFEYDNEGNYQVSEDNKQLSFDNSIIKYTDGYKNVIYGFNKWDEEWEIGKWGTSGKENGSNQIRSKDYIEVISNTTYFLKCPNISYGIKIFYWDNSKTFIDATDYIKNTTFMTPINCIYITFFTYVSYGNTYNNDICINESVTWANGNYVPYGEPLILYTETDVSGQNDINYTIWGNIKNLLVNSLQLNNNILLDIILCYTITWIIMWLLWHLIYGLLELLWHIIPRKE